MFSDRNAYKCKQSPLFVVCVHIVSVFLHNFSKLREKNNDVRCLHLSLTAAISSVPNSRNRTLPQVMNNRFKNKETSTDTQ